MEYRLIWTSYLNFVERRKYFFY